VSLNPPSVIADWQALSRHYKSLHLSSLIMLSGAIIIITSTDNTGPLTTPDTSTQRLREQRTCYYAVLIMCSVSPGFTSPPSWTIPHTDFPEMKSFWSSNPRDLIIAQCWFTVRSCLTVWFQASIVRQDDLPSSLLSSIFLSIYPSIHSSIHSVIN